MSALDESYKAYTARRALRMRRQTLDCGCPNNQDVYSHILCDRLACQQHADDEHDCSAYGGARDGTEEESEPAEAAPPVSVVQSATSSWVSFADVAAGPVAGADAAVDLRRRVQDGTAPAPDYVADAMRAEVLRQGLTECEIDGVLHEYVDGGWRILDETHVWRRRAAEVDPVAFGREYLNERVEALRPEDSPRLLARFWICPRCRTYGTRTARLKALHEADCDEPPVDAASGPDPAPTRNPISDLYAALRARARRGGR